MGLGNTSNGFSGGIGAGGLNSTMNTSVAGGNGGFNAGATDKRVNDNLEAFYKARNEIYK